MDMKKATKSLPLLEKFTIFEEVQKLSFEPLSFHII